MSCTHLAEAGSPAPPTTPECQDCVAIGNTDWVHLRQCLECGHVACCDSSPYQHATAHYRATDHPAMTSAEPGESWRWCYVDEVVG
jgi:Zn ribbon nucleic-acid-binding protein